MVQSEVIAPKQNAASLLVCTCAGVCVCVRVQVGSLTLFSDFQQIESVVTEAEK